MDKQPIQPLSVPDFVSQLRTICEAYDTDVASSTVVQNATNVTSKVRDDTA